MNDFNMARYRAQFSPEAIGYPSPPSSQTCPSPPQNLAEWERFASLAGGAGLALFGLVRGRGLGLACFSLGGALLYRGLTGHCHLYSALGLSTAHHAPGSVIPAQTGQKVTASIVIRRPVPEVFEAWRNIDQLPHLMTNLRDVNSQTPRRSRWTVTGPFGKELTWEAEIINERPHEMLSWRSLPASDVDIAGSVRFEAAEHSEGTAAAHREDSSKLTASTRLVVTLKYNPPGGSLGAHLATWLGSDFKHQLQAALQQFKQGLESSESQSSRPGGVKTETQTS